MRSMSGVKKAVRHWESSSAPLLFLASFSVRAVKPLASEKTTPPLPRCMTMVFSSRWPSK